MLCGRFGPRRCHCATHSSCRRRLIRLIAPYCGELGRYIAITGAVYLLKVLALTVYDYTYIVYTAPWQHGIVVPQLQDPLEDGCSLQ